MKEWLHQTEGVRRAAPVDHFAFLWDVGTGKTRAAIETVLAKQRTGADFPKTLIIAPGITLKNWQREFAKYASGRAPRVVTLTGSGVRRDHDFVRAVTTHRDAIFAMNHESLLMEPLLEHVKAWGPDILVIDELQRFKNMSAKRTKACLALSKCSRARLGLTGTMLTKSLLDVFAQWLILDHGATFGANFFAFRSQYFWDQNAGMPRTKYFPGWTMLPGAEERVRDKIRPSCMVVKKSECLDLPPLVRKEVDVELGAEQRRMYDAVKRDFVALLSSTQAIVATLAITKALRLMQIVSGYAALEETSGEAVEKVERPFEDNPRADALRQILEDLAPSHKIIVWAVFKPNYKTIADVCRSLGLDFVEVHGEVSAKDKDAAVDRFNTDPSVRVLLGHPRAGGIGINLVVSDVTLYYSRGLSLEDDLQSEARNYRGGSEIHEHVTRIDLVARGTIDEQVLGSLADKMEISNRVLLDIARKL